MGNGVSAEEADSVGFRVLGVQRDSPASAAQLINFFDFIVGAGDVVFKKLDNTFIDMIRNSEDKPLQVKVYNCKDKSYRDVVITPSRNWGGQGMLGVTIRFDNYFNTEETLVRVLEVARHSPAEIAGLKAGVDYLLGTTEKVFKNPDILFEEVLQHIDTPLEMYVYNTETDTVRTVVILPTHNWGGEGSLGASVGHGYLHRLPLECLETPGRNQDINLGVPPAEKPAGEDKAQAAAPPPPPEDEG